MESLAEEARADAITARAAIWRNLKDRLAQLTDGKCWYCESKEIRADKAVDHYRPKGKVKECEHHPGYWWLAFCWRNFRYCCQYCNELRVDRDTGRSGGKATHFPLLDETKRVYAPGDHFEEDPVLLDPTIATDTLLLAFDPDGTVRPRFNEETNPLSYERADISIRRYHLDKTDLKERRQVLSNRVERLVEDGGFYLLRMEQGDKTARHAFEHVVKELRAMMQEKAEYSIAVKEVCKVHRDREWVDALVTVC